MASCTFGLDDFSSSDLVVDTLFMKKSEQVFVKRLPEETPEFRIGFEEFCRSEMSMELVMKQMLRRIAETVYRAENSDKKYSQKVLLKQSSEFASLGIQREFRSE